MKDLFDCLSDGRCEWPCDMAVGERAWLPFDQVRPGSSVTPYSTLFASPMLLLLLLLWLPMRDDVDEVQVQALPARFYRGYATKIGVLCRPGAYIVTAASRFAQRRLARQSYSLRLRTE